MAQAMLPGMENTLPLLSGTPMQVTRKGLQPAASFRHRGSNHLPAAASAGTQAG